MIVRQRLNKIPNKNYNVHFDNDTQEFYATEASSFILPDNIYGNIDEDIDLYLKSFNSLDKNMGVLFNGVKGSGKTLMAKKLMMKAKLPVLIIGEPFCGNKFNEFVNSINQEIVVFFDEFEKVYEEQKHQEELLTLFDGVAKSKKIFLLTSNNNNLNEFFNNRPSRIRYKKDFNTIEEETLDEIIEDLMVNKDYKRDLQDIVYALGEVGKDLIISIIEESNLQEKNPKEVILTMNVNIPPSVYVFKARVGTENHEGTYYGNPLDSDKLTFERWYHGFEYTQYISAMRTEKLKTKITLQDNQNNSFTFFRKEKYNSLTNI